jgi:hypothetical protein
MANCEYFRPDWGSFGSPNKYAAPVPLLYPYAPTTMRLLEMDTAFKLPNHSFVSPLLAVNLPMKVDNNDNVDVDDDCKKR